MREYKFRGKKASNGEWVYGYLAEIETDWDFYNGHGLPIEYSKVIIETNLLTRPMTTIAPETIGQYTGLKDKNGKEIYEGDIIKIIKHTSHEDMVYIKESIGVVKFYYGSFIMEVFREKDRKHVNYIRQLTDIAEFIKMDNVEVIGNIYENPELLEVE